MATNIIPPTAITIRASSATRKTPPSTTAGGKWWTPLFGWSADADYIDNPNKQDVPVKEENIPARPTTKFSPGCFTEEKARQLRLMTKDTAAFHDVMYHSAIASRLASDFSDHQ